MTRSNKGRSTTGEAAVPYYRGSDRMEAAKHLRLVVARYIAGREPLSAVREAMTWLEEAAAKEAQ